MRDLSLCATHNCGSSSRDWSSGQVGAGEEVKKGRDEQGDAYFALNSPATAISRAS